MKKEQGYTLIETLIAVSIILLLSATGLYGWQRWQQQQRLWQTACQVRDFLMLLRNDANWHNRDRKLTLLAEGNSWCLVGASEMVAQCPAGSPFAMRPQWPEVSLTEITPSLGFYGLRSTAWAGHIRLGNASGAWKITVSSWGRIRLCNASADASCQ